MENKKRVDSRIDKWTKDEKFLLYEGLKKFGSHKISRLSDSIPGKSEAEIKDAIQFYKEDPPSTSATSKPKTAQKRRKIVPSAMPLAGWANFLVEAHGFEDLQNDIATALYLISQFEIRPPPESTNNIDFQKVYLMLSEAAQGKILPNDPVIMRLFDEAIIETADISKAFLKCSKFKNILKTVKVTEGEMTSFIRTTDDLELNALRRLLNLKNYNPLFLTENCLIPSTQA